MVKALINDAVNKLRSNHPDLGIDLEYIELRGNGPGSISVGLAVTNESPFSSFYSNIIVNDDIRKSL
jgi:hypothetical protein